MRWYKHMWISDSIKKKRWLVCKKIQYGKLQPNIYVLTLALNEDNLIDIYPSYILRQPYYKRQNLMIIGIAKGYDEAINLVKDMIEHIYKETNSTNVRDYIMKEKGE